MRAIFCSLALGLAAALVSGSQAQSLQPLGQWVIIPSETQCTVERSYGDPANRTIIGLHESISAESFAITITGTATGPSTVEELPARINFAGDSIKRWSLHSVDQSGTSAEKFGLSLDEMSKVAATGVVSFQVEGKPNLSFVLGDLTDPLHRLGECTTKLRRAWRVNEPDAEAGIIGPRDDLRTPFANVAPIWSQRRIRAGNVRFIVLVDETGKIAGCHVQQASGAPLLEELGCQLIRQTIAHPARDRTDMPIKDSFHTPPIMVN